MSLRAHIRDDWAMAGIGVVFVQPVDGQRAVAWAPGRRQESFISGPDVESPVEPLRLTDEEGRTLLAALLRHYEGGDDLRALRKDYEAERTRVDKLIDYATTSVRQGQPKASS